MWGDAGFHLMSVMCVCYLPSSESNWTWSTLCMEKAEAPIHQEFSSFRITFCWMSDPAFYNSLISWNNQCGSNTSTFPQCRLLVLARNVAVLSAAVYCAANAAVFCRLKVFAAEMTWNKFWLRELNHSSSRGLQLFSLTSPLLADRGWFPSLRDSEV